VQAWYTDHFVLPLPEGHRFPMQKYALLRERVVDSGLFSPDHLHVPEPARDEEILRVHDADYLEKVRSGRLTESEVRRIGFPWSPQMVERSRRSSGATIAACRAALADGVAVNLAGGTHHAFADHGEGYCVFNDSAIAARAMQAQGLVRRVVILDCDVHQGNGTAAIFAGDHSVYTFSIHGAKNFPLRKEVSDLDMPLEDRTGDLGYLDALERSLRQAIENARADLAIYVSGADPYEEDRFGRLALSKQGLAERDRMVFDLCGNAGLPVAVTMAGGYARQIDDVVDIHFQTVQAAFR
jgi:acetoin utilization deacetylase AcuC-like enzyme